jgi:hypothetical protein
MALAEFIEPYDLRVMRRALPTPAKPTRALGSFASGRTHLSTIEHR